MSLEYLEIEGGNPLCGEVRIQGSKNAALPILSAALLNPGRTVLRNCPRITDVEIMLEILESFGCRAAWEQDVLILDTSDLHSSQVSEKSGKKMRSSIVLLGSLLGRTGNAFVPYPGGCIIGKRPVDIHLSILRQMGAELEEAEEGLWAVCPHPRGTVLSLPFPSVGATENGILLAALADGITIVENAAREPEVEELCRFLNSMGARIQGAGTSRIVIAGVKKLHDTEFTIVSDRIVAGTYMLMAAAAGGKILLENPPLHHLESVRKVLTHMGVRYEQKEERMLIWSPGRIRGIEQIKTAPYPGFPTDLQSPLMAALTLAEGESRIEETIFEARFKIVEELKRMGAEIETEGRMARIRGVKALHGAEVEAAELRGGAALVAAAAAAKGKSRIYQCSYIERGYENIIRDLQALGVVVH